MRSTLRLSAWLGGGDCGNCRSLGTPRVGVLVDDYDDDDYDDDDDGDDDSGAFEFTFA